MSRSQLPEYSPAEKDKLMKDAQLKRIYEDAQVQTQGKKVIAS